MSSSVSQRNGLLDLAYVAMFAALIIVFAFVSIPVGATGLPIVLQNAIIILAGLVLGPRRGFYAAALFLGLGLLGLPVLAGGRSTLASLGGISIGYLVGYLIAPIVAGLFAYMAPRNAKKSTLIVFMSIGALLALATQYLCGSVGLVLRADMEFWEALVSNGAFLIPDLGKLVIIVLIAWSVHAAFPDIRWGSKEATSVQFRGQEAGENPEDN
ncbi:MAG: biotin transporter BioY [Corynebacterium sp.]|nr:biotin transporter BioY [Corynebacterium sp.]